MVSDRRGRQGPEGGRPAGRGQGGEREWPAGRPAEGRPRGEPRVCGGGALGLPCELGPGVQAPEAFVRVVWRSRVWVAWTRRVSVAPPPGTQGAAFPARAPRPCRRGECRHLRRPRGACDLGVCPLHPDAATSRSPLCDKATAAGRCSLCWLRGGSRCVSLGGDAQSRRRVGVSGRHPERGLTPFSPCVYRGRCHWWYQAHHVSVVDERYCPRVSPDGFQLFLLYLMSVLQYLLITSC